MRTDLNFFGTVPMPDAGNAGPRPTERRYGVADAIACYENLTAWCMEADVLGFNAMWFTEHHFQYEGYEVTPNLVMFGLAMAARTKRIRLGQMFNVVPQWHPLRLAEDFAMADILTGGRMEFGVGRGTVPREAMALGAVVASGDNDMSAADDQRNREMFEEAMEVIKAAWYQERFSYTGKHYQFPPAGIPDRGQVVTDYTLIPTVTRTVPVYQPVTSGETMEYVPRAGHHGVYWLAHPNLLEPRWQHYQRTYDAAHGTTLRLGEKRVMVLNAHVGATREQAFAAARNGHDEFCRFLAPYGRFTNYAEADGITKKPFGFQPTLEDSVEQQIWAVGSVDDVVDTIGMYRERFGVEHLCLFLDLPGLTREQISEQLHLFAGEVLPRAGVPLEELPAPRQSPSFRLPS